MMIADTWAAHLDRARDLHRRLPVFLGYVDYDDEVLAPDGGTYIDLAKLRPPACIRWWPRLASGVTSRPAHGTTTSPVLLPGCWSTRYGASRTW